MNMDPQSQRSLANAKTSYGFHHPRPKSAASIMKNGFYHETANVNFLGNFARTEKNVHQIRAINQNCMHYGEKLLLLLLLSPSSCRFADSPISSKVSSITEVRVSTPTALIGLPPTSNSLKWSLVYSARSSCVSPVRRKVQR